MHSFLNLFRGVVNADKIQIGLGGQSFFVVYKLVRKMDGKPVPDVIQLRLKLWIKITQKRMEIMLLLTHPIFLVLCTNKFS
jgi:hypothetical protein